MILEIESAFGDVLLHGKSFGESELRQMAKELFNLVSERDFPSVFCARYGFAVLPYDADIQADYTIDLDTHLVIKH